MSELRRITERYRLDTLIAASDASSVFRGTDTLTAETVAVKVINGAVPAERRERFLSLCRTLQSLQHPSLPRVLDFGFTADDQAFLVTERLQGTSFEDLAASSPTRALTLLLLVAGGLDALAGAGLASRNLRASNLYVVPVEDGLRVKILGLGTPAVRSDAALTGPEAYRDDLRAFATLACRMLGLAPRSDDRRIDISLEVAAELKDFEALRDLLEAGVEGDPDGLYPSWEEVRRNLRLALYGRAELDAASVGSPVDWVTQVVPEPTPPPDDFGNETKVFFAPVDGPARVAPPPMPVLAEAAQAEKDDKDTKDGKDEEQKERKVEEEEGEDTRPGPGEDFFAPLVPPDLPVPAPPPLPPLPPLPVAAAPARPAPPPRSASPGRSRRSLWIGLGSAAAVLALAGVAFLGFRGRSKPVPAPVPAPAVPRSVASPPIPSPAAPAPAEAVPTPAAIPPQIEQAEAALAAGDLKAAKAALDTLTPEDQAALPPEDAERYQRALAALAPLQREAVASSLTKGLATGDLRLLRSAVASVPAAEQGSLPPAVQKDLVRARKALDADVRLSRAQKAGNPLEVIRLASEILADLPRSARTAAQREKAAAAIEAEAEASLDSGQLDAAAERLNGLRDAWPDRPGLTARLDRVAAERRADQELETVLATVARAEKGGKPLDGLQALADAHPNRRWADRFQEARQRLEAQIAQLDRRPPELSLRGAEPLYDRGKTATIPLRITDDFAVKTVEGWARAEGGQFTKLALRHLSGSDWEMDVPPDLHQNKTVELYVTATDSSGHTGQLGSADRPLKVRRKSWIKQIFTGKEGSQGSGS